MGISRRYFGLGHVTADRCLTIQVVRGPTGPTGLQGMEDEVNTTAPTLSDYRLFDVVDFHRYRTDGQYEFAPVERGLITEITDTHLVVAYSSVSYYGTPNPSRTVYLHPGERVKVIARYNG